MARHADLAELCGIDIYFAEPHSPWQRLTNENGNGLLRHYVGNSTNLAVYTPDDFRAIETRINTMPRRVLGWNTAPNIYIATVAMTGLTRLLQSPHSKSSPHSSSSPASAQLASPIARSSTSVAGGGASNDSKMELY